LGFAAFDEITIRKGLVQLAAALDRRDVTIGQEFVFLTAARGTAVHRAERPREQSAMV
jgi:hypothetical protein